MYTIVVKTSECLLTSEESDFDKALSWAISMTGLEEHGHVQSVEVLEEDRTIVSLRTIK